MEQKHKISSGIQVALLLLAAALTRFIPHPFNFTAIGAMALFAGANFKDKRYVYLLPVLIMFVTDLIIGLHFSMVPVYVCFSLTVWIGTKISSNQTIKTVGGASILSSLIFFLITNLPFWYLDLKLYPMTLAGTLESYVMAIPFFKNQIAGDLFFNAILFGSYAFISKRSSSGDLRTISLKK